MRALAWLLVAPCLALVPPRGIPRRRLVLRSSYVDEVTTFLASHGVRWRRDPASDARASTLHLGDGDDEASLALRLLPSPKRLEDCLDAGSSARLTDARAAAGGEIIHLHEDVWRARGDIVRARLLARVGAAGTRRIFARKTKARVVEREAARAFLEAHHLWRSTKAKYSYGLFLGDELVAVATFTKVKVVDRGGGAKRRTHELLRFCAARDARVVGGITKLVRAFARDRVVDDLVTNVDRDWGGGENWRSLGFETVEVMPPLPMALAADGTRRYLCGRGVGLPGGRPGLPEALLAELEASDDAPVAKLAAHGLFLVHDAGVERLLWPLSETAVDAQALWDTQRPRKQGSYGPTPVPGIARMLEDAAAFPPDDDDDEAAAVASLRRAGSARDADVVTATASSCFPGAVVEVRDQRFGWRTLGIKLEDGRSIYHGVFLRGDASYVVEHLKTMAALALAALPTTRPLRCLHLGHGAGALPRLLAHHAPDSSHVSVDLDAAVVAALPAPPRCAVHVGDARAFAEATDDVFDAVFVDVFDDDNVCPPTFHEPAFLEVLRDRRLRPGGVLVHNLHVGGEKRDAALRAAQGDLDAAFPRGVFRVDSRGSSKINGNALLLACTAPLDRARLHERATAARAHYGLRFDAATRLRRLRRVTPT